MTVVTWVAIGFLAINMIPLEIWILCRLILWVRHDYYIAKSRCLRAEVLVANRLEAAKAMAAKAMATQESQESS